MSKHPQLVLALTASISLPLSPALAQEHDGVIDGRAQFVGHQGNYCSASQGMNCTGALFPDWMAVGNQPLREITIGLYNQANGALIGLGSTDRNGDFSVYWQYHMPVDLITLRAFMQNKDGRWAVVDVNGFVHNGFVVNINAQPYRNLGNVTWNHGLFDVEDAVDRTWNIRFHEMYNSHLFTGVTVTYPADETSASGTNVQIFTTMASQPMEGVSHELGHVVDFLATGQGYKRCGAFNYPSACTPPRIPPCMETSHTYTSPEHYCLGFAEGLAGFLGYTSYYAESATDPKACHGSQPCTGTGINTVLLEPSSGTGSCVETVRRNETQLMRYLWDAFDNVNDANFNDSQPGLSFWQFTRALSMIPSGTGDGQFNEPWHPNLASLDDEDGKNGFDYTAVLNAFADVTEPFDKNCRPGI